MENEETLKCTMSDVLNHKMFDVRCLTTPIVVASVRECRVFVFIFHGITIGDIIFLLYILFQPDIREYSTILNFTLNINLTTLNYLL
ncbi:hypothetical protein EMGBS15_05060 [Filimonas sp.]|nr:hypothetical protein EMGBS15_05060 [Filimonas sp.]